MTESLKFTVVDAFASKPFAGNPAAVIVLPSDKTYADSTLQSIALEFNLSETAFISTSLTVSPHGEDAKHVNFGLRWFTPVSEVPICGHATLASASVLFADSKLVPSNVNEIQFSTMSGTLFARRVAGSARMELEFPVGDIVEANQDLTSQATKAVREAIKIPDAKINFVGVCDVPTYKKMVLVDIDVGLDLASLVVNAATLENLIPSRPITVITNQSQSTQGFKVRVFANALGIAEDPVTGSASSFTAKYWAIKANVPPGEEFAVQQVSSRLGDLGVVWEEKTGSAKLRGETRVASRGEIYL